jgi:hypothetical protein
MPEILTGLKDLYRNIKNNYSNYKHKKSISVDNQDTIKWILKNYPFVDETTFEYYVRFIESGFCVAQSVFTMCVKQCGYVEVTLSRRIYWDPK